MEKLLVSSVVLVLACLCAGVAGKEAGTTECNQFTIKIHCNDDTLDTVPALNCSLKPSDRVRIISCEAPSDSYPAALQRLNITVDIIRSITLQDLPRETKLTDHLFEGFDPQISIDIIKGTYSVEPEYDYEVRRASSSGSGKVDLTSGYNLKLTCKGFPSLLEHAPIPTEKMVQPEKIDIHTCQLPKESYIDALKAIKVDGSATSELFLYVDSYILKEDDILRAKLFEGLNLKTLSIWRYNVAIDSERHFLESLPSLKTLTLNGLRLNQTTVLPEASSVELLNLYHGGAIGAFGGCSELKELDLYNWQVAESGWLASCNKLNTLKMSSMTNDNVHRILSGARTLNSLIINMCPHLNINEELFADTVALRHLSISQVSTMHSGALKSMPLLEELVVWADEEQITEQLRNELVAMHSLKRVSLLAGDYHTECGDAPNVNITSSASKMEDSNNTIEYTCTADFKTKKEHDCLYVLQWHQLDANEETSKDTWKEGTSNSQTLRLRVTEEQNGTTLLCRGMFYGGETSETKITVNFTETE